MGEGLQRAFKAARETQMVPDDDLQFLRFWAAYPMRVAKKDARKAWGDIQPTVALVDQMIETLRWQGPIWAIQGYGTPYPASWLRAERWTDEMPMLPLVSSKTARTLTSAAAFVRAGGRNDAR